MKKRVLVLTHQEFSLPENAAELPYEEIAPYKTEFDVITALGRLGHVTKTLGAVSELPKIRQTLTSWKPDIVFNLLEEFQGEEIYVPYVLGYFQLLRMPFTGCNPSGLILTESKARMKQILRAHRVPTPEFALFPRGRVIRRPRRLQFPVIVKSVSMHGSVGISQASVVTSDEKLRERVAFVHESLATDAVAEEYIEGREIYVGVLGNRRLELLPIWEMRFENMVEGSAAIATSRVKWDVAYQTKRGITTGPATDLPDEVARRIARLTRRVYRNLGFSGYARMDFRVTAEGKPYLLEPNPNPDLASDEDFAESAAAAGIDYGRLVQRILNLGFRAFPEI